MKVTVDTSGPHGGDRVVVRVHLALGQEMILNVDEVTDLEERTTGHKIRVAHRRHDKTTNLGWGFVTNTGELEER